MQTILIDPRWNVEPKTLDEAKVIINAMMRKLEEAEKILKKPDYKIVESLSKLDFSNPEKAKHDIETIVAEVKSRPMADRKPKKRALYVLPYHKGKPKTRERRRLTEDLSKKKQFEKYAAMGTKKVTKKPAYQTQFPAGMKDKDQNCEWLFEPERLEIIEDD
jgi:hypothetical protein